MALYFHSQLQQYCLLDDPPVTGPPFWISLWFRADAVGPAILAFLGDRNSAASFHAIQLNDDGRIAAVDLHPVLGSVAATSGDVIEVEQWHHVVAVWVSSDYRLVYLDGQKSENHDPLEVPACNRLTIAALGGVMPGMYFTGRIAQVALGYGIPTDRQVTALAQRFDPLAVLPLDRIAACWRLLVDTCNLKGQLHLTPIGGPTVARHPPVLLPRSSVLGIGSKVFATSLFAGRVQAGRAVGSHVAAGNCWLPTAEAGAVFVPGVIRGKTYA